MVGKPGQKILRLRGHAGPPGALGDGEALNQGLAILPPFGQRATDSFTALPLSPKIGDGSKILILLQNRCVQFPQTRPGGNNIRNRCRWKKRPSASAHEATKDTDGRNMIHPEDLTVPGDTEKYKPEDRNEDWHSAKETQCASRRQMTSGTEGKAHSHQRTPARLAPSHRPVTSRDRTDKAIVTDQKHETKSIKGGYGDRRNRGRHRMSCPAKILWPQSSELLSLYPSGGKAPQQHYHHPTKQTSGLVLVTDVLHLPITT